MTKKKDFLLQAGMIDGRALPTTIPTGVRLPPGTRLLTTHTSPTRTTVIAINTATSPAELLGFDPDSPDLPPTVIGQIDDPEIGSAASLGNFLIVAGSRGIHIFRRDSGGDYETVGISVEAPPIRFRLVSEAMPVVNQRVTIDLGDQETAALLERRLEKGGSFNVGRGENMAAASISLSDTVAGETLLAIRDYITSRGRFHHPFLVRYALRLYDGSTVSQSGPVMMLPSATVPIVTCSDPSIDREEATLEATLGFSMLNRCRLEMEVIPHELTERIGSLRAIVRAVDIAVSAPIPILDEAAGVSGFSPLISAATGTAGNNGGLTGQRPGANGSPSTGATEIFTGHYAPSETEPTADQFLRIESGDQTKVWNFKPRDTGDFTRDLTGRALFYHVASIELDNLGEYTGAFREVPLEKNSLLTIENRQRLDDGDRPLDRYAGAATPLLTYNGRLNIVPERVVHGAPPPAPTFFPHEGLPTGGDLTDISVEVTLEKDGEQGSVVRFDRAIAAAPDPTRSGLRWFCYPDPDATGAILTYHTPEPRQIRIALTPHPLLNAAVWFGGLGADDGATVDIVGLPGADQSSAREFVRQSPHQLLTTPAYQPLLFPAGLSVRLPGTATVAMAPALSPMSDGQFGAYPVYLLTADAGILVVDCAADGSWQTLRPLARINCLGKPLSTREGLIVQTREGLFCLSGSSLRRLDTGSVDDVPWLLSSLPGFDRIAVSAGMAGLDPAAHYPLRNCRNEQSTVYDQLRRQLTLFEPDSGRFGDTYDFGSEQWGISALGPGWNSAVDTPSGPIILRGDGTVCRFGDNPEPLSLLVAMPRNGADDLSGRYPGMAVGGRGFPSRKKLGSITVYGSRDGDIWYPVASVGGERLDRVDGTPWPLYIEAVVTGRPRLG
ncbi:MAG: hypothetical protein NC336_04990 [Clostridium sp.]|nr:hypothetical protein [Clostridium sp.]